MSKTVDGLNPRVHIFLESFYVLATIVLVSTRFWVLRRQVYWETRWGARKFGHLAVLLAGLLMIAFSGANIWVLKSRIFGKGQPGTLATSLTPAQTSKMLKLGLWYKLDYTLQIYIVKAGFLAVYVELSDNLRAGARTLLSFTFVYIILAYIASTLSILLYCRPFYTNWHVHKTCSAFHSLPIIAVHYVNNISTDFLLLCMAYFTLHDLNLGRRERVALGFMISIGLVTMVASSLRFMLAYKFITFRRHHFMGTSSDTTYLVTESEMFASLIALCLPAFRILLRRHSSRSVEQTRINGALPSSDGGKVNGGQTERGGFYQQAKNDFDDYSSETELRAVSDLEGGGGGGGSSCGKMKGTADVSEEMVDICPISIPRHE